jgi:parvulin-like peptidyl-prolyl isomerase
MEQDYVKKRKKFRFGRLIVLLLIVVLGVYFVNNFTGAVVVGNGDVAAVVNGQVITLVQLVDDIILLDDVKSKGYVVSDQELADAVSEFKMEFGLTDEEFEASLEEQGVSLNEFIEAMERRVLVEEFFANELFVDFEISENELRDYYNSNIAEYSLPKKVKVRHILVDGEDAATKIVDVKQKLDSGVDFSELAKESSVCPSSELGGDLGFISADSVVPEFADVVFSLDVGEISEPFETEFGYHVAVVDDVQEAQVSTFLEARDDVRAKVVAEKEKIVFDLYMQQLRANSDIEIKYVE